MISKDRHNIWFADLTHTAQGISAATFPLGVSYVYSYAKKTLGKEFDLRGMKTPFWFIPFAIYGNDNAGVLYFEQNGVYNNYEDPYTGVTFL